jgi:hypothetical protein
MPVAAARNKVWRATSFPRAAEYPATSARFRDAFFFNMTRTKAAISFSGVSNMSSAVVGTLQTSTPAYTLFDANAVALATFFGSPVAGTSLMALNYRRLGQARKAVIALILGILATGLLVVLG